MTDEIIDILDEQGNRTGEVVAKKIAHQKGIWHTAVFVWVYNSNGELLFQKRSLQKTSFPGCWEVSVSGHVSAGENPVVAACREASEELGVAIPQDQLEFVEIRNEIHDIPEKNWHNHELNYVYLWKYDGALENLTLDSREVGGVQFFSLDELERQLNDSILKKSFVPHLGNHYFDMIKLVRRRTG